MRKLGGTHPRPLADADVLEMVLPAFRNDVRAVEHYWRGPKVRINAPIVVLTAVDDPWTTMDDAKAWQEHTAGGGAVHTFERGHF